MELLETLKLSNKVILNIDQGHIWSRLAFWNILWLFGQFGILTFKTFEGSLKWGKKLSVWLKSKYSGIAQNLRKTFHIPQDNFHFPWSSLRPVKTLLRSGFDNWPALRPRKSKVLSWNVKFAYDFVLFLDIYFPAIQNYYSNHTFSFYGQANMHHWILWTDQQPVVVTLLSLISEQALISKYGGIFLESK